jgi:hypothetical protein
MKELLINLNYLVLENHSLGFRVWSVIKRDEIFFPMCIHTTKECGVHRIKIYFGNLVFRVQGPRDTDLECCQTR